jgi:hypothetical protein
LLQSDFAYGNQPQGANFYPESFEDISSSSDIWLVSAHACNLTKKYIIVVERSTSRWNHKIYDEIRRNYRKCSIETS